MKRIAPELDSLMWTLAEEGNERAIDEFGSRHPELRVELIHRINMVKGLRSAKTSPSETSDKIPLFVPREPRRTPIQSRGSAVLVGGLVLAAIAMAAFTVMTFLTPAQRTQPEALHVETKPAQTAPPLVVETPKVVIPPVSTPDPVITGNQSEAAKKPTSLRIDNAPLATVLEMMSDITGTKIISAPGMPNPNVAVDYERMSALDMLRDLGKRYSFTPLDQNDGSILVVPAVDKSGITQPSEESGGIRDRKIGG